MRDIIIIPTYNEKKNIGKLLKIIGSLALRSLHVLVVDDNSPDGTSQEVERLKAEMPFLELLLRPAKEGLGKAYIHAFKKVLADKDVRSVCTMDADFSHSPQALRQMFQKIENADVVVGSRYVKGGQILGWPIRRRLLSRLANFYCQTVLRLPVKDCTSGFICMRASLLEKINLGEISASGFAFLMELKYALWKRGASFAEISIIVENRKEGQSKITAGIVLEGVLASLRLVARNYLKKIKNIQSVVRDVFKKRGVFFIVYNGPKVFYYTFLKKHNDFFEFQGKRYQYFYHPYNGTCLNERAVEVPIVWEMIKEHRGKKILEIGNVLSHYFNFPHDVLDKYEIADGVINQDVVDFKPPYQYDLIISISTLEHVGWDEKAKDEAKILSALDNLKKCLAEGGKIAVTWGLGYNSEIDRLLRGNKLGFARQYFLKTIRPHKWVECDQKEALASPYDKFHYAANGLVIGLCFNRF